MGDRRASARSALAVVVTALAVGISALPARAASPADSVAGLATITGVVQDVVIEDPRGARVQEETRRILRAGKDVIPLSEGSLPVAENGTTVRATVAPDGDGASRVVSATTVAAAPPVSLAAAVHDVHAVIVRPRGMAADPAVTTDTITAALAKVTSYWSSQTGGLITFRVAQVAPTYESAYSCADGEDAQYAEGLMWDEALARLTIPAIPNQHLMIFAPRAAYDAGCSYGLGSVGFWTGKPGLTFVTDTNQTVVAHELGHNLSLHHSNALHCPTVQDVTYNGAWPSSCYAEEYGDLFDVMGYGGQSFGEGSLNAVQVDRMGLLPTALQTVSGAGTTTVRIAPLSAAATALRAVKIENSTGETYYVEYRTYSGRDTMASRNPYRPSLGVRVLRADPRYDDSGSYVLDATPTAGWEYDQALAVGRTFTSAARRLTITVTAADAAGATIVIANDTLSVPAYASLYGLPSTAAMRGSVTARLRLTNVAGRPVPNWPVTLQRLVRGGSAYTAVKSVRTDARGYAVVQFTQGISARHRFVTTGYSWAAAKVSNSMYVTSQAAVNARQPAASVRAGTRVTVTGTIPSVPSPIVYVQVRKASGSWGTMASSRAAVRGTAVSGSIKLPSRAKYRVRLYLKTDSGLRYLGDHSSSYAVQAL